MIHPNRSRSERLHKEITSYAAQGRKLRIAGTGDVELQKGMRSRIVKDGVLGAEPFAMGGARASAQMLFARSRPGIENVPWARILSLAKDNRNIVCRHLVDFRRAEALRLGMACDVFQIAHPPFRILQPQLPVKRFVAW